MERVVQKGKALCLWWKIMRGRGCATGDCCNGLLLKREQSVEEGKGAVVGGVFGSVFGGGALVKKVGQYD